ncbi:MAG: hypothetical protein MJ252_13545 [archaeon]|nr:hypothetical protein [archaeon]
MIVEEPKENVVEENKENVVEEQKENTAEDNKENAVEEQKENQPNPPEENKENNEIINEPEENKIEEPQPVEVIPEDNNQAEKEKEEKERLEKEQEEKELAEKLQREKEEQEERERKEKLQREREEKERAERERKEKLQKEKEEREKERKEKTFFNHQKEEKKNPEPYENPNEINSSYIFSYKYNIERSNGKDKNNTMLRERFGNVGTSSKRLFNTSDNQNYSKKKTNAKQIKAKEKAVIKPMSSLNSQPTIKNSSERKNNLGKSLHVNKKSYNLSKVVTTNDDERRNSQIQDVYSSEPKIYEYESFWGPPKKMTKTASEKKIKKHMQIKIDQPEVKNKDYNNSAGFNSSLYNTGFSYQPTGKMNTIQEKPKKKTKCYRPSNSVIKSVGKKYKGRNLNPKISNKSVNKTYNKNKYPNHIISSQTVINKNKANSQKQDTGKLRSRKVESHEKTEKPNINLTPCQIDFNKEEEESKKVKRNEEITTEKEEEAKEDNIPDKEDSIHESIRNDFGVDEKEEEIVNEPKEERKVIYMRNSSSKKLNTKKGKYKDINIKEKTFRFTSSDRESSSSVGKNKESDSWFKKYAANKIPEDCQPSANIKKEVIKEEQPVNIKKEVIKEEPSEPIKKEVKETPKASTKKESLKPEPKEYKGPIDLSCISVLSCESTYNKLIKRLISNGTKYKLVSDWKIHTKLYNVEIMKIEGNYAYYQTKLKNELINE